jgi:hypothetical protein
MQPKYLLRGKVVSSLVILFLVLSSLPGCTPREKVAADILLIEGGGVKEKITFTLEELKSMEDGLVEADYFSKNSYGTEEYLHCKGIWVWYLLREKASLKEHASIVSFIADDGYKAEYTLEDVKREDYLDEHNPETGYKMILAWEIDGKENASRKESPFQLVVGQREPGDTNRPYWVRFVKTILVD